MRKISIFYTLALFLLAFIVWGSISKAYATPACPGIAYDNFNCGNYCSKSCRSGGTWCSVSCGGEYPNKSGSGQCISITCECGNGSESCCKPNPTSIPQVCPPGEWASCATHGCGTCDSARCKSDGSGWECVWNPGGCNCNNSNPTPRPTLLIPSPTPTTPSPPTITPIPTITLTPTPMQAVRTITLAPSPTPVSGNRSTAVRQYVCIKQEPCSSASVTCSSSGKRSENMAHRVKLTNDSASSLAVNRPIWIVECILHNNSQICTTGNSAVDQARLGTTRQADLSALGYQFVGLYREDGTTFVTQSTTHANQPVRTNNTGIFGTYEWQSRLTVNKEHLFYALNDTTDLLNTGNEGGLQQATFNSLTANKDCVVIEWDPKGVVFDSKTLKPIKGATVTVIKKRTDGSYTSVQPREVIGNFTNPIVTDHTGAYSFVLPHGWYKLVVSAPGYVFPNDVKKLSPKALQTYKSLYRGEFAFEGEKEYEFDIPLDPVSGNQIEQLIEEIKTMLHIR